jgi:hypothetical protein
VSAQSCAENVPKAMSGTTDVAVAVLAEEGTVLDAEAAAPIRVLAVTLLTVCRLAPNATKDAEMELQELSDGAASLWATSRTACALTAKLGSGVTTARCGPQATERPLTMAPRTRGAVVTAAEKRHQSRACGRSGGGASALV